MILGPFAFQYIEPNDMGLERQHFGTIVRPLNVVKKQLYSDWFRRTVIPKLAHEIESNMDAFVFEDTDQMMWQTRKTFSIIMGSYQRELPRTAADHQTEYLQAALNNATQKANEEEEKAKVATEEKLCALEKMRGAQSWALSMKKDLDRPMVRLALWLSRWTSSA